VKQLSATNVDGVKQSKPSGDSDVYWFGLTRDENDVLTVYRRAKQAGFADIEITIQDGKRIKLWLTEKWR
jgi:hypothetical protein